MYIIRHGQTVWNTQKRKQGRQDSPLTLKGIEQAFSIGHTIKKLSVDFNRFKLISSPLIRAWQTSTIVAQVNNALDHLTIDPLLQEHSFGLWEGLNEEEIESNFPGEIKKRRKDWWNYQVVGGESYSLLSKRAKEFLDMHKNDHDHMIIITHEMLSKVLRGHLLNLSPEQTLKLEHPQTEFYHIHKGQLETIRLEKPDGDLQIAL